MGVKSVIRGWECEGCGTNRNTVQEVHNECVCGYEDLIQLVEVVNELYWKRFWRVNDNKND